MDRKQVSSGRTSALVHAEALSIQVRKIVVLPRAGIFRSRLGIYPYSRTPQMAPAASNGFLASRALGGLCLGSEFRGGLCGCGRISSGVWQDAM